MPSEYKHEPASRPPANKAQRELRAEKLAQDAFRALDTDLRDASLWLPPLATECLALGFVGRRHPFDLCIDAAHLHRADALAIFLDMGFAPNPPRPAQGERDLNWTGLLLACASSGICAHIQRLVETTGVGVDARGPQGATALMSAAAQKQTDAALLLLRLGADPHARTAAGLTPIMCAAKGGCPALIAVLLDLGADPHAPDGAGRNALDHAHGRRAQVLALVESFELAASVRGAASRPRASL